MPPLKSDKLWSRSYEALLETIRAKKSGENRLPPEGELAEELHVSRATLREAMQALVQGGYITRRHGKGNFAHPSVCALASRVDLDADFIRMLSTKDKKASCKTLCCGYAPASRAMEKRFPRPCGTVYRQIWLYSLGKKPLVVCKIETPAVLLTGEVQPPAGKRLLVDWLAHYSGRDIAYYATHLGCRADAEAAGALDLPAETVMQNWQELVYDICDEPIAFCDLFFHPEDVDLSMVLRF